jgi:hypothetical protein
MAPRMPRAYIDMIFRRNRETGADSAGSSTKAAIVSSRSLSSFERNAELSAARKVAAWSIDQLKAILDAKPR